MFAADALMLARLANCGHINPDPVYVLNRVSAGLRPLAERLIAVEPGQRQAIWEEFLDGRYVKALTIGAASDRERAAATAAGFAQPPLLITPVTAAPRQLPVRRVKMTCAVDVEQRAIDWLWAGRVPLGMITMFAGDPKLGKSFVTLDVAAALSRGLPLPHSEVPARPGSTILMSAEDDPARTIIPRLAAAGADLARVHILESVILANGSEALPSLRADIDAVTAAATRLGDCRLIVIDPVSAYLNGVDDNRNAALRGALSPLKNLAERLAAGVVLVSHLRKAGSANAKHRVSGSIAYVGACRANFLFVPDGQDPSGRRVLMVDNGGNVAPVAPTVAYTIEDLGCGPRVVWSQRLVPTSVDPALKMKNWPPVVPDPAPRSTACDRWLRSFLGGGMKPAREILKAASEAGFSKDQLRRARSRIGAVARKEGFDKNAQWCWELRAIASNH